MDFTAIDGTGVLTVQTILAEVGLDATRFPSAQHFAPWLGLCPGSNIALHKDIMAVLEGSIDTISKAVKFLPALPHPVLEHKPPVLNRI